MLARRAVTAVTRARHLAEMSAMLSTSTEEPLALSALTAIGSVDGRYASQCEDLRKHFSEFALIHRRVLVELQWLQALAKCNGVPEVPAISGDGKRALEDIGMSFSLADAQRVKDIEKTTNHDVKAVEYFVKEKIMSSIAELHALKEFVHFGCTSEDVNNLAYALCIGDAMREVMLPQMDTLVSDLESHAMLHADVPMLARTHGQPATPTTVGKEIINSVQRLRRHQNSVRAVKASGKFNGATGNFSALAVAYPAVDWEEVSREFVGSSLGLDYTSHSTQIEPHDWLAELMHATSRFNSTLLDFDRDMWGYISLGYFKQKAVAGEIGSSTMPHKVNPIAFENSEGNIGLANAVMGHLAEKLLVSRYQRDLSDSTVLRSIGVGFAHSLISYTQTCKGMSRLSVNQERLNMDLESNWEVLAEPIQTVMRRYNVDSPYEKLKELTRGRRVTKEIMQEFVRSLATEGVPPEAVKQLEDLTPQSYVGYAARLTTGKQ